jgi:hypothetical protein
LADVKYDPSLQDSYFRFAAEEILRRQLKRDADRLSTNEVFALLYGDSMPALKEGIKHRRIEEERQKNVPKDGGIAY